MYSDIIIKIYNDYIEKGFKKNLNLHFMNKFTKTNCLNLPRIFVNSMSIQKWISLIFYNFIFNT
jgi:hypothetical protein